MRQKSFNYLGLLFLPSFLAIFGFLTENKGFYGFLGFLYYVRYFAVIPDELFWLNVRKAATAAYFMQILLLFPLTVLFFFLESPAKALPLAFALGFGAAIFTFSIRLAILEWQESAGASNDKE